ncbi:hypothetical protein PC120_g27129, partial [Phytophthora cactorum]
PDDLARKDEHAYVNGSNESETRNVGRDTRDERLRSSETVFLKLKEYWNRCSRPGSTSTIWLKRHRSPGGERLPC